ncbi:MAG: aspartate aminotransferase family protein [Pseudomonadota bacterium]
MFPKTGRAPGAILADLEAMKAHDVRWAEGRVFAYVYDAGPEAMQLLHDAYSSFLTENGLDPTSFPSCMELERDVIAMALDLQGAPEGAKGSFTSGGTESILLSVKTARDSARSISPNITHPELVVCETTHPAFFKACAYFDVKPVVTKVDPEHYTAIPSAYEEAITDNTIMIVGSGPSYAHGVVDPIAELGQVAVRHEVLFHVDCCVGGMYLPFARESGADVPAFDLSTPGVTQMSMDFHKWGYAAKGASCILYADGELRRHQFFAWSGWTGYTVINPTVTSTKSGGPLAATWAILNHLGKEGYMDLVRRTQEASEKIRNSITRIEGLRLLGDPPGNLFCFTATDFDIFALSDAMKRKGWYIQPQLGFGPSPANLHLSVGASNAPHTDELIADLEEETARLRRSNDTSPREAPAELKALFELPAPELLDAASGIFGGETGDLPEEMREINNVMNAMPVSVRDNVLIEYFNRLYAKS